MPMALEFGLGHHALVAAEEWGAQRKIHPTECWEGQGGPAVHGGGLSTKRLSTLWMSSGKIAKEHGTTIARVALSWVQGTSRSYFDDHRCPLDCLSWTITCRPSKLY